MGHLTAEDLTRIAASPSPAAGDEPLHLAAKLLSHASGLRIPHHDSFAVSYYAGTNNIETVVYSLDAAEVATVTLTYAGGGASNDDLLTGASIAYPA